MPGRNARAALVLVTIAGAVLVTATLGVGTYVDEADPAAYATPAFPTLRILRSPGRIAVSGTSASARFDANLTQRLDEAFPAMAKAADMHAAVVVDDDWQTVTMRLIDLVAETESARAVIDGGRAEIHGVTTRPDSVASRLAALREAMPAKFAIAQDFIVVEAAGDAAALCRQSFAAAIADRVGFRQSGTEIRTSSFALLDRIVDFATDCAGFSIVIRGHSDASGHEAWNRRLSLARARSVADYLGRAGVASERLIIEGRGSSEPVADNATPQGRSLNRRVEFALRERSP
jgi:outer membrane protein OmpA-like peptidoglycan-associated protein